MSNLSRQVGCFLRKTVCDLVVRPINFPKPNTNILVSFVTEDVMVKPQEQIEVRGFRAGSGKPIIRLNQVWKSFEIVVHRR